MVRIRFHGRGGQGVKTASRVLGTACFLAGLEVQDAPRYGAERRGAPIFAYVRAGAEPIRERGIIRRPDLIVVADPTLMGVAAAGVLEGADAHSMLLLNSPEPAELWRRRVNFPGPVAAFEAGAGASGSSGPGFLGASCAAAAARLLGFIGWDLLEQALREETGRLGGGIVERNLDSARSAYAAMAPHQGRVRPRPGTGARSYQPPDWIDLAPEPAGMAAAVIHAGLTSEAVPTGLWRALRPVIDYERCNRCWWVCSAFCPDGAIRVEDAVPRIDYDHCKGCLVCLAQCPPHAIQAVPEAGAAGAGA
jgi:pyruvate ferredoxin oxidoreductase gamma subunit